MKRKELSEAAAVLDGMPPTPENPVVLIELDVVRIMVPVKGTSPLIVHQWSEKAIKEIEDQQQKKAKKAKQAKDPEAEFQACFYRDSEGDYAFPARAFKQAMVSAATSIDDKRFPKTKIRQAVFVNGDLLKISYETEPDMRTDPVRLPRGGADMRYRPEFKDWQITLDISYNASVLTKEQVINLVNLAGFAVGIGEWRPEKGGNNGRFEVMKSLL